MLPQCELGTIAFDVYAPKHTDPPWSHVTLAGSGGILLVLLALCIRFRARELRLARETDESVKEDAPLIAGSRFVSGRVEFAEGYTSAVTVRIEQAGSERNTRYSHSHEWKEFQRQVEANPFYIRRPNGDRVRVEPGDNPLLVDQLDHVIWKSRTARTRVANLALNEPIIAEGELTRGHDPECKPSADYRTSNQGWIMKPARGKPMHLCTEKLGDRHRINARLFKRVMIVLLAALGCVNVTFFFYEVGLFTGTSTCAEVTAKRMEKRGRDDVYEVDLRVAAPGRPRLTRVMHGWDYHRVKEGDIIGFRYVSWLPFASSLGTGVSVHDYSFRLSFLALLVGIVPFYWALRSKFWYEDKLDDAGSGGLPDPPTAT